MVDWARADDKDCRSCAHSARNPAFTVQPVLVCSSPKVVAERAGDAQACQVARCRQGRCGPTARFYERRRA